MKEPLVESNHSTELNILKASQGSDEIRLFNQNVNVSVDLHLWLFHYSLTRDSRLTSLNPLLVLGTKIEGQGSFINQQCTYTHGVFPGS